MIVLLPQNKFHNAIWLDTLLPHLFFTLEGFKIAIYSANTSCSKSTVKILEKGVKYVQS